MACNNMPKTKTPDKESDSLEVTKKAETKMIVPKVVSKSDTLPVVILCRNDVLGKFDFRKDTNFVRVDDHYCNKPTWLRKQTYRAFLKMKKAAQKDNISYTIVSGTRNFNHQKAIWDRKWNKYSALKEIDRAKKILEYSSMPGTSRHHWGTDIDLNNLNNSYFAAGQGKKEYDWLVKNAATYGFYQVYTDKASGRTGYNMESWHWSYLPLASQFLNYYNDSISYKDLSGFEGANYAKQLGMIENYVNGISEDCKNY